MDRRVPADDLPPDGVAIGGDPDCEHSFYEQIGSDGGANIYFNCTECSKVVLKHSAVDQGPMRRADTDESDSDTASNSGSSPRHDPLVKGLSFSMGDGGPDQRARSADDRATNDWDVSQDGNGSILAQLRARIRGLLKSKKK